MEHFKALRADWEVAKGALVAQRELMERDPVFLDATMAAEQKKKLLDRLNRLISEYDELLREYDTAPRP
ncbi:MAG TPA: hypothetical protein VKB42_10945 [Dongiaceae bacterium]|nr:hypothetical protein [Dongiaceae bacterium]